MNTGVAVAAGHDFSAAIYEVEDKPNCLVSWGNGWRKQLGHKTDMHMSAPRVVATLQVPLSLARSLVFSLALSLSCTHFLSLLASLSLFHSLSLSLSLFLSPFLSLHLCLHPRLFLALSLALS